jgi:hypothetical protein
MVIFIETLGVNHEEDHRSCPDRVALARNRDIDVTDRRTAGQR